MRTHLKLTKKQEATNAAFNALPADLRPLARRWAPKSELMNYIRDMPKEARGGMTLKAAVEAIVEVCEVLAAARAQFMNARYRQSTERPTYAARLQAIRKKAVVAAAKQVVKYGATGGTEWNVHCEGGDPGYFVERGRDWNTYSRNTKWPAMIDEHNITVPRDWRLRVRSIGSGDGVVEDAMILDAVLDVGDEYGRAVYRSRVVRAGRGYGVKVSDEWISCWPGGKASLHKSYDRAMADPVPEGLNIPSQDIDVLATFA
jgi:hypothetical protein